jgi:hypothetical protein
MQPLLERFLHQELPAGERAEAPGLPDVRLGDFEAVFGGISTRHVPNWGPL